MLISHEHPPELLQLLHHQIIVDCKFRNTTSGAVVNTMVAITAPFPGNSDNGADEAALASASLIEGLYYIPCPRDYLIMKLTVMRPKFIHLEMYWEHIRGPWYIHKNISSFFPCIWKSDLKNIKLLEAETTSVVTLAQ